MASLIYTRRADNSPLSLEEVRRQAPAAFETEQASHLSDRYGKVTTAVAIDVLRDSGFEPVQAVQTKGRTAEANRFASHLIAFAQNNAEANGTRPEVILYNSHDGSSSLKLFTGAYRFICSNGCVAGDGFEARLRHTTGTVNGFEDMLRDTVANIPTMMGRIEKMQGITVDGDQARAFARQAASLRWDYDYEVDWNYRKGLMAWNNTPDSLLRASRYEDRAVDAWTVYNRVQEKLVRGGVRLLSYKPQEGSMPVAKHRRSRPIGSVKASVEVNRNLWDLGSEILLEAA